MASLYTHQGTNVRKTWLLMTIFLVVVIGVGYLFSWYYESPDVLFIVGVIAFFQVFMSYWYSDKIVLKMTKAKPVTRESHYDLWNSVENLSITAGLPMPKVYVVSDPAPNAFATGRDPKHAAVAVTTGLLRVLDKNELEGVIAHELSHIGNRDTLVMTIAVMLVGFLALLSDFFLRMQLFGGDRRDNKEGGNIGAVLMIVGIVLMVLSPLIASLIQMAISRKREYLADASGALLTRYPEGLASALEKIHAYGHEMKSANDATAHMFIANPFGPKAKKGFHKLFMTHPPVEDRIRVLRNQQG